MDEPGREVEFWPIGERSPERGRGPARRTVRARRGGTAVAVAFFFDLDLADGIALTTEPEALAAPAGDGAPARASHWPTAVQRLPPRELAAGEPVDVVVAHDGQRVSFAWADDEDGRAPSVLGAVSMERLTRIVGERSHRHQHREE